jgi:hypothetical protein
LPETPLSEAAANTITVPVEEAVYVGAGVEVTVTAVVVEGAAVVGIGVETKVVIGD